MVTHVTLNPLAPKYFREQTSWFQMPSNIYVQPQKWERPVTSGKCWIRAESTEPKQSELISLRVKVAMSKRRLAQLSASRSLPAAVICLQATVKLMTPFIKPPFVHSSVLFFSPPPPRIFRVSSNDKIYVPQKHLLWNTYLNETCNFISFTNETSLKGTHFVRLYG